MNNNYNEKIGRRNRKRVILALMLVCFLAMNNLVFAVAVTDNDGAAFITKAEFDSLKNNFQTQIDRYNNAIDNKIDSAIASYLAGIKVEKKFEQTSLLNQLKSYSFTKNFNYFGEVTNVGDYYKYWSWYSLTYGIDPVVKATTGIYGIGLRGGTGVVNPVERTGGTNVSNYLICGKSNYDNTEIIPSYGIESYNYYYFLVMGSFYGGGGSAAYTGSTTYTGNLGSNTIFGTNFTTGSFTSTGIGTQSLGLAYSAFPMDVAWSGYDDKQLPGTTINETRDCYYINDNEILDLGSSDGTFDATSSRENLYWHDGSGRNNGSGTITLTLSKYKRKYYTKKYTAFIIDLVSQKAKQKSYYYSGLPIFKASESGNVTLKIKPTNSEGTTTTIAIQDKAFSNSDVGSGGINVSEHNCSFTDWDMNSGQEYEIEFNVKKGTTYWIKACPDNETSLTTFETTSIEIVKDAN